MKPIILALLTISTSPSPIKAPSLPDWPGNLPLAQTQAGGTFLPEPLDKAVLGRMVYLDHSPELCQAALDGLDPLKEIPPAPGPSFWSDYAWPITAVAG